MKILVLGGTRFFGRHLVHLLIQNQHEVHIFTRGQATDDFGNQVTRHIGDRKHAEDLDQLARKHSFDVIYDQMCMTANEAQTSVRAFGKSCHHYIFTSTMSVYDTQANLKETDFNALDYLPKQPANPAEEYQAGKRAAEKVFLTSALKNLSIMRIPIVVGIDDYTLRLKNQVRRILNEQPTYYPNLEAQFCFIQAADAARALHWLMQERKTGVYNFASPDAIKIKDLITLIESITQKKALYAAAYEEGNSSQVSPSQDWFLNVDKALNAGFKIDLLKNWLPVLIKKLI